MNKSTMITVLVILLVILGIGAYALTRDPDTTPTPAATPVAEAPRQDQTNTATDDGQPENSAETAATITYTDSGFTEQETTVPVGSAVLIRNDSSSQLEFSSDEHPTHTDNPELNTSILEPGETTTITPEQTGTWGFHNHLRDSHTGTIIVG